MAGQTDHKLRGDYSRARADYTVDQDYSLYTPAEQDLWKRLYARQSALVPQYACDEFIDVLATLNFGAGIPRFDEINAMLFPATRWTLVAVPGLLPDDVFFNHLANRRFPVSVWLRTPEEFEYIVEPDIFHDFFGHVPLLFNPVFADYLEAYGKGGVKAKGLNALDYLARLYWYTVEFGLIQTPKGLRTYGAGILSSTGELPYCITSPKPNRIKFDLLRVMQSNYKIDTFQETYFVIDSFKQLFDATAPDFTPYYEELRTRPDLAATAALPTDTLVTV
ncbi:MAG: phenylalanine 4-monooxygenase [Nitrosomonadaceae bacterium]|nr:phenylalanine 4-monooxygenase [Nitrosomonadaceae bacterium]